MTKSHKRFRPYTSGTEELADQHKSLSFKREEQIQNDRMQPPRDYMNLAGRFNQKFL